MRHVAIQGVAKDTAGPSRPYGKDRTLKPSLMLLTDWSQRRALFKKIVK
ncbi:hypothetical protein Pan97_28060 [Bremerella volcania]|uniref:Uncharacterized protein n=1 Tax=Bremerella volcania TaxID=2527984 RepID=A0A518C997_9BACT|nr:hypothetical protein Pan97_28060 [Bremerella volcania]